MCGPVAINPGGDDGGTGEWGQLPGSFGGGQMAKPVDYDFDDFENSEENGTWDIPDFSLPPSWE